jgi:hypothetical protein
MATAKKRPAKRQHRIHIRKVTHVPEENKHEVVLDVHDAITPPEVAVPETVDAPEHKHWYDWLLSR